MIGVFWRPGTRRPLPSPDAVPPVGSPDHLEIHHLAYDQGVKAIDHQGATVESIHQRASAIATVNAAVAAFLGHETLSRLAALGHVLQVRQLLGLSVALLSLCLSVFCVIQMLRPRKGWLLYFKPSRIIDQFAQGVNATDLSRTYEVLARFTELNYSSNDRMLRNIFGWLWAAFLAVIVQIAAWLITMY
jgi:hypothetical protein